MLLVVICTFHSGQGAFDYVSGLKTVSFIVCCFDVHSSCKFSHVADHLYVSVTLLIAKNKK